MSDGMRKGRPFENVQRTTFFDLPPGEWWRHEA
jgi:hypothetical protein